jgi:hypothetical protein
MSEQITKVNIIAGKLKIRNPSNTGTSDFSVDIYGMIGDHYICSKRLSSQYPVPKNRVFLKSPEEKKQFNTNVDIKGMTDDYYICSKRSSHHLIPKNRVFLKSPEEEKESKTEEIDFNIACWGQIPSAKAKVFNWDIIVVGSIGDQYLCKKQNEHELFLVAWQLVSDFDNLEILEVVYTEGVEICA